MLQFHCCSFLLFSFSQHFPLISISSQCSDSCFSGQQSIVSQQERSNQVMKKVHVQILLEREIKRWWADGRVVGIQYRQNSSISCEARFQHSHCHGVAGRLSDEYLLTPTFIHFVNVIFPVHISFSSHQVTKSAKIWRAGGAIWLFFIINTVS